MLGDSILPTRSSILDKLIDSDPKSEIDHDYPCGVQHLWASLLRDLENLLNARVSWHRIHPQFNEVDRSIVNYGLPDFSAMPFSSETGQEQLCDMIKQAIRQHEPRLRQVAVELVADKSPIDRVLRLRISATVVIDEKWHDLSFDTEVEPVNLAFKLNPTR